MKLKKVSVVSTPATKSTKPQAKVTSVTKPIADVLKGAVAAQKSSAAAPAQSTSAAPAPKARTGANIGVKSGLRIMRFQDLTFAENDQKVRPTLGGPGLRTDAELAAEWNKEFPNSIAVQRGRITAMMVQSVRHLFNNGTGDHGTKGQRHNSKPYILQGTTRVLSEAPARTRTVPAAKPEATPTPAKPTPADVAKAKAKIVTPAKAPVKKTKAA